MLYYTTSELYTSQPLLTQRHTIQETSCPYVNI